MNRKALFLDRDGIINEEKDYVHKIEDFEFMAGIFEVLRHAQASGYLLIVVTNQAGIARGYYSEEDFHSLNNWMIGRFQEKGIKIDKVYYCPYHPTHGIGKYLKDSEFRKPGPGMIQQAAKEFGIDPAQSLLVGDKESDIEAGKTAGIGKNILLKSSRYDGWGTKADTVIENLQEVIPFLK